MKHNYVLLFALPILTYAATTQGNIKRKALIKPTLNCKKIKCPAVDDPICVKLKTKNDTRNTNTTYVLMINKCELNYMKCHQHVEAVKVQMKYCDHNHITRKDTLKPSGTKRVKRSLGYEPRFEQKPRKILNVKLSKKSESAKRLGAVKPGLKSKHSKIKKGLRSGDEKSNESEADGDKTEPPKGQFFDAGMLKDTDNMFAGMDFNIFDKNNNEKNEPEKNEEENEISEGEVEDSPLAGKPSTVHIKQDMHEPRIEEGDMDFAKGKGEEFEERSSEPQFGSPEAADTTSEEKPTKDGSQESTTERYELAGVPQNDRDESENDDTNKQHGFDDSNLSDGVILEGSPLPRDDQAALSTSSNEPFEDGDQQKEASQPEENSPDVAEGAAASQEASPEVKDNANSDDAPTAQEGQKKPSEERGADPEEGEDYDSNCPKECPSRAVMVCGKCQHGVFRTFMSVCHLRQFNCQHDDELMELISRYPCVASAPYLSSSQKLEMSPVGKKYDPGDVDQVLRFIDCRSKGLIEGEEPWQNDMQRQLMAERKRKCSYDSQQILKQDESSFEY